MYWKSAQKDFYKKSDVGTYLITIVVEGRTPVFGNIEGNIKALPTVSDSPITMHPNACSSPATALSPLGLT